MLESMAKGIKAVFATGLISLAGLVNAGCMIPDCRYLMENPEIYEQRIQNGKGLIVAMEGVQPSSGCKATTLGAKMAEQYGWALSASSGDWRRHVKACERVARNGGKIAFVLYSAANDEGRSLARELKKKGVRIKKVIGIEHTYTRAGNIFWGPWTDNVDELVGIRSSGSNWWGGDRDFNEKDITGNTKIENYLLPAQFGVDLEEHLSVPERAYDIVDREFQEISQ
jgi:hypothetical protein